MNDTSRRSKWNTLLRFAGFIASMFGLFISAQFSVDGFSFSVDDRAWIGWAMAGIIIVLESVWQKFGENRTLFIIAMICYGYGVVTNVLGMLANRGGYDQNPWSLLVPIVFGVLLEVFPEPLLAWSISGDTSSDPIGKFLDGLHDEPKQKQSTQPNKKHIPFTPAPKSSYKAQHRPLPMPHAQPKPYPRQSPYLNLVREMKDEDGGELIG
jgi:hypothetical protein